MTAIKKFSYNEYIVYLLKNGITNDKAIEIADKAINKQMEENKMENKVKKDIAQQILDLAKTKFSPEEISASRSRYYSLANLVQKQKVVVEAKKKKI